MSDVTLARWFELDEAGRAVVVDQLLERVPPGYIDPRSVGHRAGPLPSFIHQETNVLFHVVFGGPAVIGMSDARFERLGRLTMGADDDDGLVPLPRRDEAASLMPSRVVQIDTALVADEVLPWGVLRKLGLPEDRLSVHGVRGNGVGPLLKALSPLKWRAPSEAEWEYVCRAAEDSVDDRRVPHRPVSRLALTQLVTMGKHAELCRDTWHDTLAELPERGSAGEGHEVLRGRGEGWRFYGMGGAPAWNEALWPGRRRQAHWAGVVSFRPWVDLLV